MTLGQVAFLEEYRKPMSTFNTGVRIVDDYLKGKHNNK
jgi:hypothetical protein